MVGGAVRLVDVVNVGLVHPAEGVVIVYILAAQVPARLVVIGKLGVRDAAIGEGLRHVPVVVERFDSGHAAGA